MITIIFIIILTIVLYKLQTIEYFAPSTLKYRTPFLLPYFHDSLLISGDFQTHTVFSDGHVWPTFRVDEAWTNGLDALSITDHHNYFTRKKYVKTGNLNQSYNSSKNMAKKLNITLIKGIEWTGFSPHIHCNILFVKNANKYKNTTLLEALQEAKRQNSVVFWNHPCGHLGKDDKVVMYPDVIKYVKQGLIHGVEAMTLRQNCLQILDFANKYNLTVYGNSDIHRSHKISLGNHHPRTLIFTKSKLQSDIKKALIQGNTLAYGFNMIYGKQHLIKKLVTGAVQILNPQLKYEKTLNIKLKNISSIPFQIHYNSYHNYLHLEKHFTIKENAISILPIKIYPKFTEKNIQIFFRIINSYYNSKNQVQIKLSFSIKDGLVTIQSIV